MKFNAYKELTKPKIAQMVVTTFALGFFVGSGSFSPFYTFCVGLITSTMVCSGVSVLNQVIEWKHDLKMERTKNRPIPANVITKNNALIFGLILTLGGVLLMYLYTTPLFTLLGALTAIIYVLIYTPLKRVTWWNTTIGSVPGSLPPLGGYLLGKGELDETGWLLFAVLFFWQHSHFYAIAWLCKTDYSTAGFKMISDKDSTGKHTFTHAFIHSILLLASCVAIFYTSMVGYGYLVISALLSLWFAYRCYLSMVESSDKNAKRVLTDSLIYLVVFTLTICIDLSI